MITKSKQELLILRMQKLNIQESDLVEKFIRGSGSGGQKINKTSSTVQLTHIPSGFQVKCQDSRSLSLNRYYSRVRLCDLIENHINKKESEIAKKINKLKKQKAKRTKRAKEKILNEKKITSKIKEQRQKIRL